jgi:ATP-dependent RNA helicase DeaD
MSPSFADLQLHDDVLRAIEGLGFEQPTPIQAQTIPLLLEGRDVVAQAQTGTGKTAAFALPIAQRVDTSRREVQALVLAPTRELAIQVAGATQDLGRTSGLAVLPIYGGQAYDRQLRGLRSGVHVVVGTPGRVMDHIRRGSLDLSTVQTIVLDEADEMLDMGFVEDIEFILGEVPAERQIALFSATVPRRIDALIRRHLRNPARVAIAQEAVTATQTRQMYVETPHHEKVEALTRILEIEAPSSAIVFCRTKREVDELSERLQSRGHQAAAIHGDVGQAQRERLLLAFRDGRASLLIATEVAARGLDIPEVTHVFNYDIPGDVDAYIHRIGRTGRMGRTGHAITFVAPRERRKLRLIENRIQRKLTKMRVPTNGDIAERRQERFRRSLQTTIESGVGSQYASLADTLAQEHDPLAVVAAALYLANGGASGQHDAVVVAEPPVVQKPLAQKPAAEPPAAPPPADDPPAAEIPASNGPDRGATKDRGVARLHLNAGRHQGLRPQDVVGALTAKAGIPAPTIGTIDLHGTFALVDVQLEAAELVLKRASLLSLNGRVVRVSPARSNAGVPGPDTAPAAPPRHKGPAAPPRHKGKARPGPARSSRKRHKQAMRSGPPKAVRAGRR